MPTSKEKAHETAAPGPTDPTPPSPAEERQAAVDRARWELLLLEERWTPMGLRAVLGLGQEEMSVLGVRMFLLKITSGIKDPVEKMLVQQFTIAHHRLLQLHGQAAETQNLEAVKVFNAAAARLQGELRRLALAIRQYRLPVGQKTFSVVHQQNVVSGGDQRVQYVDMGKGKESLQAHDELKGKTDPLQERNHASALDPHEEPSTRSGWQAERRQATAVDG